MFTTEGGVEIEQVAAESPDALARVHVDPLEGFEPHHARELPREPSRTTSERAQIEAIVETLYRCFVESDATLCEINPLIVTPDGRGARARRQGDDRRLGALPPSRSRRAAATRRRPTRSRRSRASAASST